MNEQKRSKKEKKTWIEVWIDAIFATMFTLAVAWLFFGIILNLQIWMDFVNLSDIKFYFILSLVFISYSIIFGYFKMEKNLKNISNLIGGISGIIGMWIFDIIVFPEEVFRMNPALLDFSNPKIYLGFVVMFVTYVLVSKALQKILGGDEK